MIVEKGCHLALGNLELGLQPPPWKPPPPPWMRDVMGDSASALMIENVSRIEYDQCVLILKDLA